MRDGLWYKTTLLITLIKELEELVYLSQVKHCTYVARCNSFFMFPGVVLHWGASSLDREKSIVSFIIIVVIIILKNTRLRSRCDGK